MNKMTRNFIRHLWVGFNASAYLSFAVVLLYQYLAVANDLPGRFLTVMHTDSGGWWMDIQWSHPFVFIWLGCVALFAVCYACKRRNDSSEYREPGVESQPGF